MTVRMPKITRPALRSLNYTAVGSEFMGLESVDFSPDRQTLKIYVATGKVFSDLIVRTRMPWRLWKRQRTGV